MKATAGTAKIVIRSRIGARPELQLRQEDLDGFESRRKQQEERLARIAARLQDPAQ